MITKPILKLKTSTSATTPTIQKQTKELAPNTKTQQNQESLKSKAKSKSTSMHKTPSDKHNLTEDQQAALKVQVEKNKLQFKETFTLLHDLYPNCFNHDKKPLAVGIHKELRKLHPDILPKQRIFKFLNRYCNDFYRKGLVLGVTRINLDGSDSSLVTQQEIEFISKLDKTDKSK